MNSEEINKIINKLAGDQELEVISTIYESCIGDKIIPYIGWFWRDVDFDSDYCYLGIIPIFDGEDCAETDAELKVGFMENNKWGYDMFKVEGEQWQSLKDLIINAIEKNDSDSFRAVDLYMQSLLPVECR
jgi:hypothetical protein